MAFDQSTRNRLQKFVNDARNLLTEEFNRQLQATYGLDPKAGSVAAVDSLTHLDNRQRQTANVLRDTLAHYLATTHGKGEKDRTKQALSRIVREQAFTVLNRLAALRMAEARGFLLETIAKGYNAKGFQLYKQLAGSSLGETGEAYRNYLYSVFDEFSLDLAVLFDRHSAQGRLFPRESALLELLDLINHHEIEPLWAEDETIGWIYQYFNSQEERKKMRAESQAPRNSRELAVRNQFFTPRYVVEFLTDNTLGRIWYEMTQGKTSLIDSCRYLVRRPTEVFLKPGKLAPEQEKAAGEAEALSQEELLKQPVYIPHRTIKDPRCIRMLDPACGSMHFGLYAFDLYERIYEEAWQLEAELGADAFIREGDLKPLYLTYEGFEDFKAEIPRLIIEHNIHGVDIDPRAVQIAGLSLWQRAQRAWQQQGIKPQRRPVVRKSNIVCAEPMPGEKALLQEFSSTLNPPVLGQLIEAIFDKMELAGEAGSLLKIEEEIQSAIRGARDQWQARSGSNSVGDMFQAELDQATPQKELGFDLSGVDDESFWDGAEQLILDALSNYADKAESNADQKRLFAEDAAKGFAFIDLCRMRFDVVLMNPPFGEACGKTKPYIKSNYKSSYQDILQCFVDRSFGLLNSSSYQGVLSARTGFFFGDSDSWREDVILNNQISIFADLGLNVLDDALVEVAAYSLRKGYDSNNLIYSSRHLSTKQKELSLLNAVSDSKKESSSRYNFPQDLMNIIPSYTFAYWVPPRFLNKYIQLSSFGESVARVRQGMATADDFRFVRLSWEVPQCKSNSRWIPFSKGGEYSPFYDDIHLVVDWGSNGEQLKAYVCKQYPYLNGNWSFVIKNSDSYFKEGVTYTVRTASAFAPKFLPKGAIYSHNAQTWQLEDRETLISSMGYFTARGIQAFVDLATGGGDVSTSGSAARRYTTSIIEGVPSIDHHDLKNDLLYSESLKQLKYHIIRFSRDETARTFSYPYLSRLESIESDCIEKCLREEMESKKEIITASYAIDNYVNGKLCLGDEETDYLFDEIGPHPCSYSCDDSAALEALEFIDMSDKQLVDMAVEKCGPKRWFTKKSYFVDRKLELLSHAFEVSPISIIDNYRPEKSSLKVNAVKQKIGSEVFGGIIGRFSEEFLRNGGNFNLDEFVGGEGFDIVDLLGGSPAEKKSGIIEIDDQTLKFEEIFIREISKYVSSDRDEIIKIFGSVSVTTFFSNTKHFFSSHLSEYSKSRRQAPIYWPLQTPSGSYTLWVYYHRLNEQTLYACVNDFVQPKLEKSEQDINTLRGKSARSTQEEKELEKLSDLVSELRDFRDELLRLAKFWKPNLNDGVQITAAPLWKLFQHKAWQKKLKETWEKLEKGDYDWAHLASSIWPERVLRKCHQDRSLAIAHDVENTFWHEVEVPVMRGKKAAGETKLDWQPKELADIELDALIQAKIMEKKA